MQDEVNEKTMALCIKGGKISAQILKAALTKLLAEIEKKKQQSKKMGGQNRCKRGKQSIKSLQQSGAQLTNIVVTDNNIKSFDRVARKYGIAVRRSWDVWSGIPVHLQVFWQMSAIVVMYWQERPLHRTF